MKKLLVFFLVFFAIIFSAYKIADYATTEQMKSWAKGMVNSYNRNHHLRLHDLVGLGLNRIMFPVADDDPGSLYEKSETDYHQWVKTTALKNRKTVISWITEERLDSMLNYVNEAAVEKKMSLAARDSLFKELRARTDYYLERFLKLQAATPIKRWDIFKCSARISPRNKAYSLQSQLEQKSWDGSGASDIVGSVKELRARLSLVGIKLETTCDDFYGYSFTRYSQQYDYLFSLLRWATYLDGGKVTEDAITGWTEPTIKALIDDGVVLLQKTKKAVDAYQVK